MTKFNSRKRLPISVLKTSIILCIAWLPLIFNLHNSNVLVPRTLLLRTTSQSLVYNSGHETVLPWNIINPLTWHSNHKQKLNSSIALPPMLEKKFTANN